MDETTVRVSTISDLRLPAQLTPFPAERGQNVATDFAGTWCYHICHPPAVDSENGLVSAKSHVIGSACLPKVLLRQPIHLLFARNVP